MGIEPYYISIIYTVILAIITIILVPLKDIKKLTPWALLFGYVFDWVLLVGLHLLGLKAGYYNYGPFGFWNISFFPLMSWTVYFILYLHYLPSHKLARYIMPFVAGIHSTFLANVLLNLGVYMWAYERVIIPYLIFTSWQLVATTIYDKFENKIQFYK